MTFHPPSLEEFARVRAIADEVIAELVASGADYTYNRLSFRCVEVVHCLRDDGDSWWRVTIEEASPNDDALSLSIFRMMEARGFPVEVDLQW